MTKSGATTHAATGSTLGDILQLIQQRPRISRSDIARETGLALSTASLRVDELIRHGAVTEVGPLASRGGRRAIGLEVDPGAGAFACLDIVPGDGSKAVIVDLQGGVLARRPFFGVDFTDPDKTVRELWNGIVEMAAGLKRDASTLAALCVAVPAPIEHASGTVISPARLPGWHGFSVKAAFERLVSAPVIIENSTNLEAVAEYHAAGQSHDNLVVLAVGDHIGCGLIVDGKLHRGSFGAAGEIGHNSVPGDSVIGCTCSAPNCLESVASARAINVLLRRSRIEASSPDAIVKLGNGDNMRALEIIRNAGRVIGVALGSVVNLIDPETVVISGGLAACIPLVKAIRSEVFDHGLPLNTGQLEIRTSALDDGAALEGAMMAAMEFLFEPERVNATLTA